MGKLEKYSSYKDSGVEWIGEIPEHWEIKKLKFIIKNKLQYGANESGDEYQEDLPRYIRITDFSNSGKLSEKNKLSLSWEKANKYLLKDGDILFARSGATVGKTYQFKTCMSSEKFYAFAGYLIKAQADEIIVSSDYLYTYTNSNLFEKWKENIFNKSTIENIGADKYSELFVVLPLREEQTIIMKFLNEKTSQIDEVISQKEKLIELLKERKQIVINDAVTKGLDKNVEFVDSGVEWIGQIPKHWKLLANKYVFKLKKNLVGKKSNEYDLLSLTLEGIIKRDLDKGGKFPAEFDTYQEVKKGDFVFCLFDVEETPRTVGLSKYDGMITGAYTVFSVENINKEYLYYFYLNLDSKKRLKPLYTGLRNTISKDNFFSLKSFIPPKDEQLQIVKYIENQTTKIDKAIELQQNYISKLKEYKASLIDSIVTGKERVA
ncbi:restriction endonuclease subunit S [Aliarcobacter butzleri]|uniref:restriction endonuclease subunit S n=1 Tax=Aliarcobacter butzleri TaxID=28197 RepID=UPI002B24F6CD|nr:restriction endonuclease subunit S [Aliarcobacter butzleri]